MREITIELPKPHLNQKKVLNEAKRFNVLCNGRRWGKSKLSIRLIKPAIISGHKIGFWNATYKDLSEVWTEVKYRLNPIIKHKDEQLKKIELVTGGKIDMWSMDDPDSGRGFSYHRAIMDEFAKAKHCQYAWEKTIRPTLTDYAGDAWFLSTPKGMNNYFYDVFSNENKYEDWASWQMPTHTNPFISKSELEQIEQTTDPITYRQEYLAEFINKSDQPFFYCFEDKHISDNAKHIPNLTIYLSFDFNVNPITCIMGHIGTLNNLPFVHIFDEIGLFNQDIYELCRQIKSRYPNGHFMVTGDASGKNRTALGKNLNYYYVIKKELGIKDPQFRIPGSNPSFAENIVLCNSILSKHNEVVVNPKCKELIYDLRFTQWDGQKIVKDDRSKREYRADYADCFSGETLVTTYQGSVRIDSISIGSSVLTRKGYRKCIDKWSSYADVYEVEMDDGTKVLCTKDHKFYSNSFGLSSIFDIFVEKKKIWRLSTMESSIGSIQNRSISTAHQAEQKSNIQDAYIGRCGMMLMEKYHMTTSYIIKMAMRLIIQLKILNLLNVVNINLIMLKKECKKMFNGIKIGNKKALIAQGIGMGQRLALNGTMNMQKDFLLESSIMDFRNVSIAQKNIERKQKEQDFVQTTVKHNGGVSIIQTSQQQDALNAIQNLQQESLMGQNTVQENADQYLIQMGVKNFKYIGKRKVWDITIDGEHEFFANGILVHNCFRYYCNSFLHSFIKKL